MAERTVFTAGELAERAGIEQDALDRWVDAGLVQPDGRGSTGVPFFSESVIERIGHIRRFLEMGYGEEEIAKILRKVGLPEEGRRRGSRSEAENLLTVGALAESVGVSPRTIKHWEDKGIIEADARSEGGFRLYQEHYVYLCHLIQDLQLFGYSLDQIKQISEITSETSWYFVMTSPSTQPTRRNENSARCSPKSTTCSRRPHNCAAGLSDGKSF
ncbi:MAG: MerR family transcriptional regulator [Spirochaetes bacterium]|nr:MerR family transcriptional regulator [Spirochaetota bacterium]